MDTTIRDKAFSEWRSAEAEKIPELAARIFALRCKGYMGCGFHWSLEKRLGAVMHALNDYDDHKYYHTPEAIFCQIVLEVGVEKLWEDIEEIERQLAGRNSVLEEPLPPTVPEKTDVPNHHRLRRSKSRRRSAESE